MKKKKKQCEDVGCPMVGRCTDKTECIMTVPVFSSRRNGEKRGLRHNEAIRGKRLRREYVEPYQIALNVAGGGRLVGKR